MKVVINTCFGGFGLSREAYIWLIRHRIPVRAYVEPARTKTGTFKRVKSNEGRVIFSTRLTPGDKTQTITRMHGHPYWETWTKGARADPLLVRCVEELGAKASGKHAALKVVTIPDDVQYTIEEYDGSEHIAEKHRTWA